MIDTLKKKNFALRWTVFIRERFSPLNHFLFNILFFSSNTSIAATCCQLTFTLGRKEIGSAIVTLFMLFHLRIFDEIKDYEKDQISYPERPLAKGLISVSEAKQMVTFVIFAELLFSWLISLRAFSAAFFTLLYSLIMYKEFFRGSWLRQHPVIYAFTHTFVSSWMSLFVFSAVTRQYFWQIPKEYGMFLLVNWMLFSIFEFARKTFAKEEERDSVDSYSKSSGPFRAALNVILTVTITIYIAIRLGNIFESKPIFFILLGLLFAVTLSVSILYAFFQNIFWAKKFRTVCSIFIVSYSLLVTFLIRKG
jgi:4-hydroxybenzoate polyprenyltransferase